MGIKLPSAPSRDTACGPMANGKLNLFLQPVSRLRRFTYLALHLSNTASKVQGKWYPHINQPNLAIVYSCSRTALTRRSSGSRSTSVQHQHNLRNPALHILSYFIYPLFLTPFPRHLIKPPLSPPTTVLLLLFPSFLGSLSWSPKA